MVYTQYTTELGSLPLKDLNQKFSTRPKLLPITEDTMTLKSFVENTSQKAYDTLIEIPIISVSTVYWLKVYRYP